MFASAAVAFSAATPAMAASTALVIGGIGAGTMNDLEMAPLLGGALKNEARVNVGWPAQAGPMTGTGDMTLGASIGIGVTNLTAGINSALGNLDRDADGNVVNGEKVTVVGLSAGSLVVDEVLRQMMAQGTMPDPSELTFILVEDSSRQQLIKDSTYNSKLDYTYHTPPATPYDVVVVTGEYDGFADFPDRPWNALAVANAMAGIIVVHVPVMYYGDLSKVPAEDVTVTVNSQGGTTTHYLIPTTTLPLVQLFPALKPKEAELKAKIDAGYSRNDPAPATATATATAAKAVAATAAAVPTAAPAVEKAPAVPTTDTTSARAARAQDRAQAKADAAAARQARKEARAAAKADAAAARQARKEARAAAKADAAGSSPEKSGASDSSGSSK
ncbi:PE-PPE domain-containing protein [Mycolicibacterium chubuense]|uniref:PE-PPE domain-containing protein n=1 Tax=Mycolicibacterium chubuense TaxID=1800 RepID=UPI0002F9CC97